MNPRRGVVAIACAALITLGTPVGGHRAGATAGTDDLVLYNATSGQVQVWNAWSGVVSAWLLDSRGTVTGTLDLSASCGTPTGCSSRWRIIGLGGLG